MKYGDVQKLPDAGLATADRRRPRKVALDGMTKLQPQKLVNVKAFLVLTLVLTLAGCATTPPPLNGSPELLSFLTDGKTSREAVITTLGPPFGRFESEKILTYRLGFEPRNSGYYVVEREITANGWPTWTAAKFSLVLVFDDAGILLKHSLVKVNK